VASVIAYDHVTIDGVVHRHYGHFVRIAHP
jgi:hypothetical protein